MSKNKIRIEIPSPKSINLKIRTKALKIKIELFLEDDQRRHVYNYMQQIYYRFFNTGNSYYDASLYMIN